MALGVGLAWTASMLVIAHLDAYHEEALMVLPHRARLRCRAGDGFATERTELFGHVVHAIQVQEVTTLATREQRPTATWNHIFEADGATTADCRPAWRS